MPPSASGSRQAAGPLRLTAGRGAALAIGVPVCLALVAGTGLSLVAQFGQGKYPVSYTAAASAKTLNVSVSGGQLDVVQGKAGQRATLTGTAVYSLVRSQFTPRTTADSAAITYQCPMPVGDCELNATATVPPGMPVVANSGGGNDSVTGTTSPVRINTSGGNVSVDSSSGPLTVSTGGGDVDGTGLASPAVTISSGGGNITLDFTTAPRDVRISTGGGDITVVIPPGPAKYDIRATSAGGSVNDGAIRSTPGAPNRITLTTGGGNISIRQQ